MQENIPQMKHSSFRLQRPEERKRAHTHELGQNLGSGTNTTKAGQLGWGSGALRRGGDGGDLQRAEGGEGGGAVRLAGKSALHAKERLGRWQAEHARHTHQGERKGRAAGVAWLRRRMRVEVSELRVCWEGQQRGWRARQRQDSALCCEWERGGF